MNLLKLVLTVLGIFNLYFIAQSQQSITKIAFGSCNRQDKPQPLWKDIISNQPDLWIWMGDNIYGDSDSLPILKHKYDLQKDNSEYKELLKSCPVIGVWDDHDYGRNDAGKEYRNKDESQQLLLDFLDEPRNSPRRKQKGVYSSYTYGAGKKLVKVILLDTRYFRDSLMREGKNIIPNDEGDILGEDQWKWLERELKSTKAPINLIVSGIQIIPEEHRFEKWSNFPNSKKRLFDLIGRTKTKGVVFLSGDRHFAEISKLTSPSIKYPLYEITSSGLTHSYSGNLEEKNQNRIGEIVNTLNFGVMEIDWNAKPIRAEITIRGLDNIVLEKHEFDL